MDIHTHVHVHIHKTIIIIIKQANITNHNMWTSTLIHRTQVNITNNTTTHKH